ncbi:PTS sugar transporter subunit IIA [Microbacterium betulae]|uniref:PTS sugar transporter subunit IIA n=1 Tax=Microbacterium betulae TaxID=2981139 RepID=A0AA97FJW8_9MICO|nr:PTS sugar transporter subunit IIA [Microbacterium sp. AB]WOF24138.1 PTS sugar transporter subunit IIA [Microbacterium sp. AB]
MSRQRQDRLVAVLLRDGGWMTAAALSDLLGVTTRSIRSYVTAVNARLPDRPVIASGPAGYRVHPTGAALLKESGEPQTASPRDRLHRLIHALIDADDGVDVHETADALHVSDATLESDLARVRALVREGGELALERHGPRVALAGSELARRRLLSSLAHDEMEDGSFDVEVLRRVAGSTSVSGDAFGRFKADLAAELGGLGYFVNEFAAADVTLHVSIAVDRARQGRALETVHDEPSAEQERFAEVVGRLAESDLGVALGRGDRMHLASLLLTRVVVPGAGTLGTSRVDPVIDAAVRAAVTRVSHAYLVALEREEFVERLSLHVQNLAHRAREQAWSRNPLTRSLKATYPMIFEVAVSIAGELSERLGMSIRDDEIAYIAMHVGGELERGRREETRLTATIVCPGYYELHELLRSSITRSLGQAVEVTEVVTRIDPDWKAIATDLVLTTIEPPTPSDRIVRIRPFLTDGDVERVTQEAARIRRARRLSRLRAELERYFDAGAFARGLDGADGEEGVIRRLGGMLVERGVIDDAYVEGAIERERMSSTAFTDALAVPHALRMTATRTAIAIGIADSPVPWGDSRVQVVALAAFSESDREAFQTVFEQFVEVFGERENAQRIIRRGTDFAGFLDELVAIIGS